MGCVFTFLRESLRLLLRLISVTTREALAAITDRGEFELLATAVLRLIEPDCAAVIHHGLNAKGEPVKGAVDAWCRVPGTDRPRFVLVQHTTTDRQKLRSKWLMGRDGDLPKAGVEATKLRAYFPDAIFRLFLSTNFVPGTELQRDVYSAAAQRGLDVTIVDQSRLADYLDTPEGQYLRRKVLRIEADSLSKPLLAELSRKSADLHAQRFLSGEMPVRVERETDRQVAAALHDQTVTLHCLVADAGFGKSTTASLILTEHIDAGGFGLWISESVLAVAVSLEDAITRTLCSLHPSLSPETASLWRKLCVDDRLLLLLDDINPTVNREALLRKLQGWTAPSARGPSTTASRGFVGLCPVWTHVWEATRDPNKKFSWVSTTLLGPMQPPEAAFAIHELAALSRRAVTEEQALACAENLNCDPYLLGIFGVLLKQTSAGADPVELTRDVVAQYVNFVLRNAVSRSSGKFTIHDYQETLAALSTQMLLRKDLRPRWCQVRDWLKESAETHVREAAEFLRRDSVIYRLVDGDALVFRHDRLMQHLLRESISHLFQCEDVIGEVFYAELLGQSLAISAPSEKTVAAITERNPLVLFEALRAIRDSSTATHAKIIDAVMQWVRRPEAQAIPEALRQAIGATLMETDSPVILEIGRYLRPDYGVLAACLRNGSAWAGACLLGQTGRHSFDPAVRHTWRNAALNNAIRNHRPALVRQLDDILRRSDLSYEQSLGAILLAGYLAEQELADGIALCAEGAKQRDFLVAEALWAIGRCCGPEAHNHLDRLFKLLQTVSDEKDRNDWSPRRGVARNFRDFPTDTFHPDTVAYIVRVADEQPALRDLLYPLVHALDSPQALEHLARFKADQAKARGEDTVTSLYFSFSKWDRNSRDNYRRPTDDSLLRLRMIWQSDGEDCTVRSAAFKIWSWSADVRDINHLQTIPAGSPLYRTALWHRAELGDRSCISEIARVMREDEWFANVAHHVWSKELYSVTEDWLEKIAEKALENFDYTASCLGDLLSRIPATDAEQLLNAYWPGLREHRDFVQAALLIATPLTLMLADEAIRSGAVRDPFAHLAMQMNDLRQRVPGWSAAKFLRGLEPYLDHLTADELWHYPLDCRWAGESQWCRDHIIPRMSDEMRRQHFADEVAIASEIETIANDSDRWRFPKYSFEHLLRNEADPRQIIKLAVAAFQSSPSLPRYTILAESIAELGNRSDIPLLNQVCGEPWAAKADDARANAEFRLCRRTLARAD